MSGHPHSLSGPVAVASDKVGGEGATRLGYATILLAFGGFGLWAALAPLHAAAVAHGEVKVENYRKTIQHMEGGMVRSILVRDGDEVRAGQPLMLLDDTAIRAKWSQLTFEYWDLVAARARLQAERAGAAKVDFSLMPKSDHPHMREVMAAQEQLFEARRELLGGQVAVLKKRLVLYDREADALQAEQISADRQLTLIREEIHAAQYLFDKGLGRKPQLLSLKREAERLQGQRDDHSARIARLRQAQSSTELDIANLTYKQLDEVATELREVDTKARDVEQQITAAEDSLKRMVVRSPQNGEVVGLNIHTIGGVLKPGDAIMDVVPRHESLMVEARISPEDIDRVQAGRDAQIRFRTFLRGLTPPATGKVTQVSADLFHDERTGEPYYQARVDIDPQSLTKLPGRLTPGMQTDVLIISGERTALQYWIEPLSRAIAMAMREK